MPVAAFHQFSLRHGPAVGLVRYPRGEIDAFMGGSDRRAGQWWTWVQGTIANRHQFQPGQSERSVNWHQGRAGERGEA